MIILSTATPGAEQGALMAAIDLGLTIAGWRCASDDLPPVFASALTVTSSSNRGMARRLCVQGCDGVLALSSAIVPLGVVAYVDKLTEDQGVPFLSVTLGQQITDAVRDEVIDWIRGEDIKRLYVCGPAEDDEPGVQAAVRKALAWLLEPLAVEALREFMGGGMRLIDGLLTTKEHE